MWHLKTGRKTQVAELIWTPKEEFNVLRSQGIEANPALRIGVGLPDSKGQARQSRNSAKRA